MCVLNRVKTRHSLTVSQNNNVCVCREWLCEYDFSKKGIEMNVAVIAEKVKGTSDYTNKQKTNKQTIQLNLPVLRARRRRRSKIYKYVVS